MVKGSKLPVISIITVSFNASKTIEKTIQSVINQNYPDLEYIFIDGGSTDQTVEIIKKYSSYISKLVSEPDKGPFDAMNKGIEMASGNIIGIINADDWYEPGTLNKVATIFKQNSLIDVISGNMQYWEGEKKGKLSIADLTRIKKEMSLNHPAVFVNINTYRKWGNFDLSYKLASDYELVLRFYMKGCHFRIINETLSNMSLEGLSDRYWKVSLLEVLKIKSAYLPIWKCKSEYMEIYLKEQLVRSMKTAGFYGFYKSYKNLISLISGKEKRFEN